MLKISQEKPCPHCGKRTENIRVFSEKKLAYNICITCLKTPTGELFKKEEILGELSRLADKTSSLPENCEGTGSWSPPRKISSVEGGTGWYGC